MKAIVLQLLWFAALAARASAVPAHELVARGNEAYQAGDFDEAISRYDEASVTAPEAAAIWFNKGAVHYRKERYEDAAKAFQEAAVRAKEPQFAARAKFNLGDCAFRQAERQRDSDLGKAIEFCRTSIGHYQEALRLDPQFQNAAENIEVVRLYIKTLLDEQKKQQEQQQQQQKDQKDQKDQPPQQQQDQQQKGDSQQQDQQQQDQQQQQADQDRKSPQEGSQEQQQQQTTDQGEDQKPESNQGPEQQAAAMPAGEDTANGILNEEKENRQRMQAVPAGKGRPVEKDW
jgi:Ca-activated chloride channel family protein